MTTAELAEMTAPLAEPLKMQLSELRSAITKEACCTVTAMAQILRSDFQIFAEVSSSLVS